MADAAPQAQPKAFANPPVASAHGRKGRRHRALWLAALCVPILLVGGVTLYWHLIARQLEQQFALWLETQRAAGWTTTTGVPVRGGWPLTATLTVPAVSIRDGSADAPGDLAWNAEKVTLQVSLLRPTTFDIIPAGTQHLHLANGPDFTYTATRLRITLPVQQAIIPDWANLMVRDLHVSFATGKDANATLTIGHMDLRADAKPAPASGGVPTLAFSAVAQSIDPPAALGRLLAPRINTVTVDGALDGPMPRAQLTAEHAAAWRDGGGTLEIQRLAVNWGPLDLTASVTLALDDELQPMGAGTAHIVGYAEALDALSAHGVLSRSAGTAAKAVLSLLAHAPEDGSPPDVDVPLTLQYRTLAMRQVPLLRLPELAWP